MKIVRLIGGLGNQMFQYALFLALKQAFPKEQIYTDASLFSTYHIHNGLELNRVFGITLEQAPLQDLKRLTYYTSNYTLNRVLRRILPIPQSECRESSDGAFDVSVLRDNSDRIFCGYWQDYRYFEQIFDVIRDTYCFPPFRDSRNQQLQEKIKKAYPNTVSLHIRRGDYLKSKIYAGTCPIEYYRSALASLSEELESPSYYIFSDDIEYCRRELSPFLQNGPVAYVDWNQGENSYCDIQLMNSCRVNIIANSSFSWWAAFLNPHRQKIICAPRKWLNREMKCKYQMPEWRLY